ncbi:MAG: primosomal protein [Flammeovirgaceae bacterium]|nr:primosomal protein [Flammeovirgaceae bacterium]|tara:strand:- start:282 stop:887 length:606 start_codon:yes stop_codon:yes gene_type:complete
MAEKTLLREFMIFEAEGVEPITDPDSDGILRMKGVIQKANAPNANNRIYPRAILEREDKNMQQSIEERRALGECDHPDSPIVQLENASHLVTKTWWDGDNVLGEIEILDTPKGKILESLINRNVKLGISSRGLGSTKKTNEGYDLVEDDFQLVTYDLVSNPSTSGAYLECMRESKDYKLMVEANRAVLLDNILNDILGLEI